MYWASRFTSLIVTPRGHRSGAAPRRVGRVPGVSIVESGVRRAPGALCRRSLLISICVRMLVHTLRGQRTVHSDANARTEQNENVKKYRARAFTFDLREGVAL